MPAVGCGELRLKAEIDRSKSDINPLNGAVQRQRMEAIGATPPASIIRTKEILAAMQSD